MKLNNKGMTTAEILICFVLVTTIMMSIYSTVSAFNDKRIEENNRSEIIIYKNLITQKIQDDFVRIGLIHAKIYETNSADGSKVHTVEATLKDGSKRILNVSQRFTKTPAHLDGYTNKDDEFKIEYGTPSDSDTTTSGMESYPLPELGEVSGTYNNHVFTPCLTASDSCKIAKDLQINNVIFNITNEKIDSDTTSHVLSIYIGFYHPELGSRYAINIICPINYNPPPSSQNSSFNFVLS